MGVLQTSPTFTIIKLLSPRHDESRLLHPVLQPHLQGQVLGKLCERAERLQRSVRQSHPPCPHLLPLHSGGPAPGRDEAEARVREAGGSDVEKQAGNLPPSHPSPSRGQRQDPHCGIQLLSSSHRDIRILQKQGQKNLLLNPSKLLFNFLIESLSFMKH